MWSEVFGLVQLADGAGQPLPSAAPSPLPPGSPRPSDAPSGIDAPPAPDAASGAIVPFFSQKTGLIPIEMLPSIQLVDLAPPRPRAATPMLNPVASGVTVMDEEEDDLAAAASSEPLPAGCGQISREAKAKAIMMKPMKSRGKGKIIKMKGKAKGRGIVRKAKAKGDGIMKKAEAKGEGIEMKAKAKPVKAKAKNFPSEAAPAEPSVASAARPPQAKAKAKAKGRGKAKAEAKAKGKAKAKAEVKMTPKCVNSRAYHAELRLQRRAGVPDAEAYQAAAAAGRAAVAALMQQHPDV
jgi:hypothetical protein